jgi:hypothetical protein
VIDRLSYANVMSTLAVFLVLAGGTALAAGLPKGSVKSATVKNGSLRSVDLADGRGVSGADVSDASLNGSDLADRALGGRDLADGSLGGADFAPGTVRGADFRNDSIGLTDLGPDAVDSAKLLDGNLSGADVGTLALTGADIVESSLGEVPDTARLGGHGADQFLPRGGIFESETAVQVGTPPGRIEARCGAGNRILSAGPANVAGGSVVTESFPAKGSAGEDVWVVVLDVRAGADPFSVSLICFDPTP